MGPERPKTPLGNPRSYSMHNWILSIFSVSCFSHFFPQFSLISFSQWLFWVRLICVCSCKKRAKTPAKHPPGTPQVGSAYCVSYATVSLRFENWDFSGGKGSDQGQCKHGYRRPVETPKTPYSANILRLEFGFWGGVRRRHDTKRESTRNGVRSQTIGGINTKLFSKNRVQARPLHRGGNKYRGVSFGSGTERWKKTEKDSF